MFSKGVLRTMLILVMLDIKDIDNYYLLKGVPLSIKLASMACKSCDALLYSRTTSLT